MEQLLESMGIAIMTIGTIPGTFSATSYDIGDEGVAYFDSTPSNEGLAGERYLDAVDVSEFPEFGGLQAVSHVRLSHSECAHSMACCTKSTYPTCTADHSWRMA